MDIKTADIVMVAAVLIAPLAALQVQIWLERYRAYVRRQEEIFRMLMATRGARLSPIHIEALNRIDLEFYGRTVILIRYQTKAERRVIEAWRSYHHILGAPAIEGDQSAYYQQREMLFIALLRAISDAAGYDFDDTHLKQMSYTPQFYGNVEADQSAIRQGLAKLFSGDMAIPVQLVVQEELLKKQAAVSDAILSQIGPDGVIRVRIVEGSAIAPQAVPPR